jgi:imidazolonepropionase
MTASSERVLWRNAHIATLSGDTGWGLLPRAAMVVEGNHIAWIGPESALPASTRCAAEHDLGGALLTPGLIDAHTHLVYGGERAGEFERRLLGESYEAISRGGGGIRSSVVATRAADAPSLQVSASRRLAALVAGGVTTVEIKSGYGLTQDDEARCLRVARQLGEASGVTVRTTSLALHALPPEFEGLADDYVAAVCSWLPLWHAEGLVDAVDAFCEHIAFSPAQVQRVFECAMALGLPVKLHAEQLSDSGGTEMACGLHAHLETDPSRRAGRLLSCDHLEHLSAAGVAAMKASGAVAMLLPGAFHFLRETKLPPINALRAAGVPIAIATDHNPGTSPTLSMPLMIHLACVLFRLTPEEALRGATVQAARALGLPDRGRLALGKRADFAVWDLDHPRELAYAFGHVQAWRVVAGGAELAR